MRDHRKPPVDKGSRHEGAPMPSASDSGGFSIESTTVRLKSMRLRRAQNEKREFEQLAVPKTPGSVDMPASGRPSGRVKHDERGVAVWDFAIATGEFASLSQTAALKKLSIGDLEIEDHKPAPELKLEKAGRDKGGGFDPYNQRGSGKRVGEAATRVGVTGSPTRDRAGVLDQLLGKK
jgi:hypothetical protein